MADKLVKVGRIALRVEGDNWHAYWAAPGTMQGAVFLGAVTMRFVNRADRKAAFMAMMRDCVGDLFEDQYGVRPEWPDAPAPAPENERTRQ